MTKPNYLKTRIFIDSGNPDETKDALTLLGFLDGQTTNPSLVAKNPHIQELKEKKLLDQDTIWEEYRKVALAIHEILPNGSISVEVFSDSATKSETMIEQGRKLALWFPGVFVKLPTTTEGLKAAEVLAKEGTNINMTLCFSQEQAAAVHMATVGAKRGQIYISPFMGRLDDIGEEGFDVVKNISKMYREWGSPVMVLGASIRNLDHLFNCLKENIDIVTVPLAILTKWKEYGIEKDPGEFVFAVSDKKPIPFEDIAQKEWTSYDVHHDLTDKGIKKFDSDWEDLFK